MHPTDSTAERPGVWTSAPTYCQTNSQYSSGVCVYMFTQHAHTHETNRTPTYPKTALTVISASLRFRHRC